MALDPAIFTDFNDLKKGDHVTFWYKPKDLRAKGVVTGIWMGVEEMCEVKATDGKFYNLCRRVGDEVEKVIDGRAVLADCEALRDKKPLTLLDYGNLLIRKAKAIVCRGG